MKHFTYLLCCLFLTYNVSAQVGINIDNSDPDASAMLDIKSTNKGVLIPRMSSTERQQIMEPAVGLMVYDSTAQAFYYFNGMGWLELLSGSVTMLSDEDNDTKIQVEESADEDVIRFDVAGNEFMKIDGNAIELISPSKSTIIGEGAGQSPLSNDYNAFFGFEAGKNNNSGLQNTFLGAFAGKGINNGQNNVAIGTYAAEKISSGYSNVYIGDNAGRDNIDGNGNTFLGMESGRGNTGSNNVFLGNTVGKSTGNINNRLYIDNSNTNSPLLYGEFDNDLLRINGTLNINNAFSFPTTDGLNGQVLRTDGNGTATWANLSSVAKTFIRNGAINAIVGGSTVNYATDDFIFGSSTTEDIGNSDHDSRFFFDKSKGAFRAGIEEGDKWDDTNVGIGSIAMGSGNTAAGENSVAMGYQSGAMSIGAVSLGYQNGALGDVTVAIGNRNIVDTDTAFAIGSYNYADKDYALAVGTENEAQEEASTAIGYANLATAVGASAFGEFNEANGTSSLALGSGAIANGTTSVAIGSSDAEGTGSLAVGIGNTASGDFSQAFGSGTTTSSGYETAFGYFNTTYTPTSTSNPSALDRLFVIGNGIGPVANQRSDALIILKNGATRINGPLTLGISGNDLTSYTLPNVRGSDGQILQMQSSGTMGWVDLDDTDNQIIDELKLSGTTLEISLEDDGQAVKTVNLSSINSVQDIIANSGNTTSIDVSSSNVIEFKAGGQNVLNLQRGNIQFENTNGSIYFGADAGKSDDFMGPSNIGIGDNSLSTNNTGSNNMGIGNNANVGSSDLSNATAIGANALVNQSNALVLGNNADVGIGTSTPDEKLHVVGNVKIEDGNAQTGYVLTSDANGVGTWQQNTTGDDNQTIDQLLLSGTTLSISLENDGQATKTVDLSGLAVPVGTIMMWATSTPPAGWVLCDGASITAYPQLVSVLGSNNAPNLEDRFPYSAGRLIALGGTGGNEAVTLNEANIPPHTHDSGTLKTTYPYKTRTAVGSQNNKDGSDENFYNSSAITGNTGSWGGGSNGLTQSFSIMPPYVALNFIIKAE